METLFELANRVATSSVLFSDNESPFSAIVHPGKDKVLLITGENASGKSVFFQVMAARAKRDAGMLGIQISIRERTGAGTYEGSGFRRAVMFGDESEQSTGATSVAVVKAGFGNSYQYAKDGKSNMLMLDEPELGLSAGYAKAMGAYLGQQAGRMHKNAGGLVVVTHSRDLVRGLLGVGISPSFANLDPTFQSLQEWLGCDENRTVDDLLSLTDIGHQRAAQVRKLIKKR